MALKHPKYVAAVVQAAPEFLDVDATVEKTIALIEEAARQGASIVAFPEDWIPGYPWHVWLDTPAANFQRGFVGRYFDNALSYDDANAAKIAAAARDGRICVSLGIAERSGGSLYIGNWIIDAEGRTLVRRRKLKPTHMERTVFGEGDGSDLVVRDTPLGRIGVLACWEHLQPLTKYAMYAQNEQVHIAAWPGFSLYKGVAYSLGAEVSLAATQTYALEGGCFVLAPSAVTSQAMVDLMCDTDEKRRLLEVGGGFSMIYGPDGSPLVERKPETWEGVICQEIDLAKISLAKAAADPAGHYARADVTRLLINRRPNVRVQEFGLPFEASSHPNATDDPAAPEDAAIGSS
ncbi:carbon-nitrogen hydrolase family protein [Beijerinckia sp. L45]|uniref:carbon-nitrogen hydrolase family protein n=1 Tax=Beijerinckia sp. L45 TaxID=1641855 RepID=UPI00131E70E9|nr:carbon-nitrogen hydrolase family protein [Beijerinckia sp. L45]